MRSGYDVLRRLCVHAVNRHIFWFCLKRVVYR